MYQESCHRMVFMSLSYVPGSWESPDHFTGGCIRRCCKATLKQGTWEGFCHCPAVSDCSADRWGWLYPGYLRNGMGLRTGSWLRECWYWLLLCYVWQCLRCGFVMRPGFLLIRKNQNNNPVFGGASVYDLCLAGLLPAGWCSDNFHIWKLSLLSQTHWHDLITIKMLRLPGSFLNGSE